MQLILIKITATSTIIFLLLKVIHFLCWDKAYELNWMQGNAKLYLKICEIIKIIFKVMGWIVILVLLLFIIIGIVWIWGVK